MKTEEFYNTGTNDSGLAEYMSRVADMRICFPKLVQTYNACTMQILGKYGLFPGQPQILFELGRCGRITQNELASLLNVSKSSAGTSLKRMERAGFVKRERDKEDSRRIYVELTRRGKEYSRWCEIDFDMLFTTMLEGFAGEEREKAPRMVETMYLSLEEMRKRLCGKKH